MEMMKKQLFLLLTQHLGNIESKFNQSLKKIVIISYGTEKRDVFTEVSILSTSIAERTAQDTPRILQ